MRRHLKANILTQTIGALLALTAGGALHGQTPVKGDFAVTYTAEAAKPVADESAFWLQGGSVEAGWKVWRGLGFAANLTGTHSDSFGPSAIPLSLLSYTFGPRYRYPFKMKRSPKRLAGASVFGEVLVGGVHGYDSLFPHGAGESSSANSYQTNINGGFDLKLNRRFDLRALEIGWVHMGLPNSVSDVQNDLRLSAGIVLKFGGAKAANSH